MITAANPVVASVGSAAPIPAPPEAWSPPATSGPLTGLAMQIPTGSHGGGQPTAVAAPTDAAAAAGRPPVRPHPRTRAGAPAGSRVPPSGHRAPLAPAARDRGRP